MSSPLLLALDTSTSTASLALFDGTHVLSETTWLAGREHSTRLLIEVDFALERVGRVAKDLTGLVVARGPGSFTGVRVALSVAKGIAGGFGIPAWGVNSLDILALAACPSELPVRAVIEAGRGRYATALYLEGRRIDDPRLATLDELERLLVNTTLVIGELREDGRTRLEGLEQVRLAPRSSSARRAGFLAELGWRMAQRGDPGDARSLDALYIT
jgi:tRNA threonylcarbamoyladenosine biosynthesis protein TsaB